MRVTTTRMWCQSHKTTYPPQVRPPGGQRRRQGGETGPCGSPTLRRQVGKREPSKDTEKGHRVVGGRSGERSPGSEGSRCVKGKAE